MQARLNLYRHQVPWDEPLYFIRRPTADAFTSLGKSRLRILQVNHLCNTGSGKQPLTADLKSNRPQTRYCRTHGSSTEGQAEGFLPAAADVSGQRKVTITKLIVHPKQVFSSD